LEREEYWEKSKEKFEKLMLYGKTIWKIKSQSDGRKPLPPQDSGSAKFQHFGIPRGGGTVN